MAPTGLSVFNVSGSRPAAEAPEKKAAPKPRPKRAAAARETPVPRPPKPPAPDASTPSPFKMIIVSKEAFGASDIGKRSEEHTSELQSLMRTSYAVFCLKKKKPQHTTHTS